MSAVSEQVLSEVAVEVLEAAAFLFVEPGKAGAADQLELQARIALKQPRAGLLSLATSAKVAKEIAANMLGVPSGDPSADASAGEALGELANVVAGALLARLFGAGEQSAIGVPTVGPTQGWPEPAAGEVRTALAVEGSGSIALALLFEPEGQA
jgi:CheY-specific phosphatase CheX